MSQPCRFGSNCVRANCSFMHPGGGGRTSEAQQFDQVNNAPSYQMPNPEQRLGYAPPVVYSHPSPNGLPSPQRVPPQNYMIQQPQHVPKVSHPGYAQEMVQEVLVPAARPMPPQQLDLMPMYGSQNNMRLPMSAAPRRGPVPMSHANIRGAVPISHGNMGPPIRMPQGHLGNPVHTSLRGPVHGNLGGPISGIPHDNMDRMAQIRGSHMGGAVPISRVSMGNPNLPPVSHGNMVRPSPIPVPRNSMGGPQMGGPQMGGPQMGGRRMGGPQMGGPRMGGPHMGRPHMGVPNTDDSWKDEWIADSRNCECCHGYVYRCNKLMPMCHSEACSCSCEIISGPQNYNNAKPSRVPTYNTRPVEMSFNALSLNDANPQPISSPPSSQYHPSSYQPHSSPPYPLPSPSYPPPSATAGFSIPNMSPQPPQPSQTQLLQQYSPRPPYPQHQQLSAHPRQTFS